MSDSPENPEILPAQLPPTQPVPAGTPVEGTAADGTQAIDLSRPLLLDPVWSAWALVLLVAVSIVTLLLTMIAVLFGAQHWFYRGADLTELARNALVVVAGQSLGYGLIFVYMYLLVRVVCRAGNFADAVHWNFPSNPALYLGAGVALSIGLQIFAHLLPIPKNLPIDTFFSTSREAWVLTIFGITVAPLMEELLFRGFLYPTLKRYLDIGMDALVTALRSRGFPFRTPPHFGTIAAVLLTAIGFALLHGSQLKFAWGPLLVIFIVGLVLTAVRARKNSVAASLLMHFSYNLTLSALMYVASDGFRHLEKLRQ